MATNKMYKNSRIVDGIYFSPPKFIRDNVDFSDISGKEFLIQAGDRLDIIAEQLYGSADDWKYIALFNNIEWFFLDPGTIIRLPSPEGLKKIKERV